MFGKQVLLKKKYKSLKKKYALIYIRFAYYNIFIVVTTKSQILAPEVMIPHRKWRIITRKWRSAGATWIMGLFHDQWISQ